MFFHAVDEGAAADVEIAGGLSLVAAGLFQRAQQQLALDGFQASSANSSSLTLVIVPCLYAFFETKEQDIEDTEMKHHLLS